MTAINPENKAGRQRLSTSVAPATAQWLANLAQTMGLPVGRVLDSLRPRPEQPATQISAVSPQK